MSAGIDVRQAIQDAGGTKVTQFIAEVLLTDSSGDLVTTGTTNLELLKLQADGTLQIYDFDSSVRDFVASSPTSRNTTMTHRQAAGTNTGIWTAVLDQHAVNAMDLRGIYYLSVTNTGASPKTQVRKFQFGDVDGDGFAFMQIAGTDAADAYGTCIEANAVTRASEVQDTIVSEVGDVESLVQLILDLSVMHESLISNVVSVGGEPPVTVTLTTGGAAGFKAGQVVVIEHDAGGRSLWRISADSAGTTIVLQGASGAVAGVVIGDTVRVLSTNNLTELISTGNASAATAVTQTTASAIRDSLGLTAANLTATLAALNAEAGAVRRGLVRLQATVSSVVISGQSYGVTLEFGSTTIGTFENHVAFATDSNGDYKAGPLTMGNSGSEGLMIVNGTLVVGDKITVLRPVPTLSEIWGVDADGYTLPESLKLLLAAMCGKGPGSGAQAVFRAADDSKARITATVTAAGDRTAVTLDATG